MWLLVPLSPQSSIQVRDREREARKNTIIPIREILLTIL